MDFWRIFMRLLNESATYLINIYLSWNEEDIVVFYLKNLICWYTSLNKSFSFSDGETAMENVQKKGNPVISDISQLCEELWIRLASPELEKIPLM